MGLTAIQRTPSPEAPEPGMGLMRKAKPQDIEGIMALGMKAMTEDPIDRLTIAPDKMREVAEQCISGAGQYAWVVEYEGEIVAAVLAIVDEMLFYRRRQASVVQFYTVKPGEGVRLLRHFLEWARGRPLIRMITFTLEVRADPRIGKLLTRLGLKSELPVYVEIK